MQTNSVRCCIKLPRKGNRTCQNGRVRFSYFELSTLYNLHDCTKRDRIETRAWR